ncbi:MAG TPA: YbbR-like domain-containing protein [bacterium]|nr:YbbR-like domain-containing protein [bacterium]
MKAIRDFFTVNGREKVLALLATFAIWVGVIASREEPINFSVKVRFDTGNERVVTTAHSVETIHIQAKGSVFAASQVRAEDLEVVINARHRDPGRAVYFLDEREIPLSRYLKIEQILPREVTFTVSKKIAKTVAVDPTLDGQPKKGYRIASVERRPTNITITGPEEIVAALESVPTERIDITGLAANSSRTVRVSSGQPGVEPAGEDGTVAVTVAIERDIRELTLPRVPLLVDGELPADIEPAYVAVRVKGPAESIEQVAANGLKAFVQSLPARLYVVDRYYFKDMPPGIEILEMEKVKQLTVRRKNP